MVVLLLTFVVGRGATSAAKKKSSSDAGGRRRRFSPLLFLGVGGLLGSSGTVLIPPFIVDGLIDQGIAASSAAGLLAVGSITGVAARVAVGGLSDLWPRPFHHLRVVEGMMLVAALSMIVLAFSRSQPLLTLATVLAFGIGWSWPGLLHHAVLSTHPYAPGRATGAMQMGTYLGAVVGPGIFGLVVDHVSFEAAWTVAVAITVVGVVLLHAGTSLLQRGDRFHRVER